VNTAILDITTTDMTIVITINTTIVDTIVDLVDKVIVNIIVEEDLLPMKRSSILYHLVLS
jgi:hypothetical protein